MSLDHNSDYIAPEDRPPCEYCKVGLLEFMSRSHIPHDSCPDFYQCDNCDATYMPQAIHKQIQERKESDV